MALFGELWSLTWEPVRYFARHAAGPPSCGVGAVAPIACACLYVVYGVLMVARVEPLVLAAVEGTRVPGFLLSSTMYGGVVAGACAFPLLWLACAGFLVSVDALFVDRGRPLKQLELAGRAFLSQVPCLVLLIGAAALFDVSRLSEATGAEPEALARLGAHLATTPLFAAASVVTHVSRVWLCILLAMGYQSIARISHGTTAALVLVLYGVFFLTALVW